MRARYPALLHDPVAGASRRVAVGWDPAASGLLLEGGEGGPALVPAAALTLSGGGWQGEALHLSWQAEGRTWAVTLSEPEAVQGLLAVLPPRFADEVARLRAAARRRRWRRAVALAILAALLLLPLLGAVGLFVFRAPVLDAVVRRLPTSIDARLGELAARQVAATGRLRREGPAVAAVRAVAARLTAAVPEPRPAFRFEVLADPAVNAFAAPGGLVVVHTGLLAEAASADELAGVLAHEMTHVLERHALRQLLFQLGLVASLQLLVGLGGDAADRLASALTELGTLRFSRDQERAADRGAVALLERARLPADGLQSFFERLAARGDGLPALVSTHPPSAERSAALRRLLQARGPWPVDPLGLDWAAVRQDAAGSPSGSPRDGDPGPRAGAR